MSLSTPSKCNLVKTKQLTKPLKPNLDQTEIKPNLNQTDNNASIILYCGLITLMQTRQTRQTVNQRMLITISHLCVVASAWTDMVAMLVTKCDSINWQINIGRSASGWISSMYTSIRFGLDIAKCTVGTNDIRPVSTVDIIRDIQNCLLLYQRGGYSGHFQQRCFGHNIGIYSPYRRPVWANYQYTE